MSYKILPRTYDIANKLGIHIEPSKMKNKKIDVYGKDGGYIASIGDNRYMDFPSYIESNGIEYAQKRRKLYIKRHKGDEGHIRGYLTMKLLWS